VLNFMKHGGAAVQEAPATTGQVVYSNAGGSHRSFKIAPLTGTTE